MKRYSRYFLFLFLTSTLFPFKVYSQQPSPVEYDAFGNAIDQDAPNTNAPIDGGITLLLAAGIGYGVKKYRDNKMKTIQFE